MNERMKVNMNNQKKNKILLIYPPITLKYAPNPMDIPVPHIGVAYIASVLLKNGYDVEVKDCPAEEIGVKELLVYLEKNEFNIIGISTYYFNINSVIRIVKKVKEKDTFVFAGGMLPTLSANNVLKTLHNINCCVIGEGEITVLELVDAIESNHEWRNIDGLAYINDNKEFIATKKRKLIGDLDDLPFPFRVASKRELYTPILASRGCYGNCNFCSIESYYRMCAGRKVRIRDPRKVVDEIEQLVKAGHSFIKFNDENFNVSSKNGKEWFETFYTEIKKRKVNAKYIMDMRVNEIIYGREEIEKFMEIGLDFIFIGVESFLQKHLDFFNKKVKVEDNLLAMKILDEIGANYRIGLLLFNPITTIDDIRQTLNIIEKVYYLREENMMKPISLFQPVIAVAGTPIYDFVIEKRIYKNNGRGYEFIDKRVEDYYDVVRKWAKNVDEVYENRFLANEHLIIKKAFQELYKIDLSFLKELIMVMFSERNSEETVFNLIDRKKKEIEKIAVKN